MTTELVLRLDKKRAEHLAKEARKRRKTPNVLIRQALDNLLGEPCSDGNEPSKAQRGKTAKKTKGAGWAEHFEWLRKHGRRVDSKTVDEILAISRNRSL